MAKNITYNSELEAAFLESIEVEGLTALTRDHDNKSQPFLLRTSDGRPARTERAYAPIGIGRVFDFSDTSLRKIPPQNPEHEQLLRQWIAEAVLVDLKKHCYGADAFYLYNPTVVHTEEGYISDFGYNVLFYKLQESSSQEQFPEPKHT